MTGPFPPHRLRNQGARQWISAAAGGLGIRREESFPDGGMRGSWNLSLRGCWDIAEE